MKRRIIEIDRDKCDGCGACAEACHEGAIAMIDGKAQLIQDDYCDGLGDCLPACHAGAIRFVEREALPYDEAAVKAHMAAKGCSGGGCPGQQARAIQHDPVPEQAVSTSQLQNWPVQIKLAPLQAPYFDGAKLLIAADCTAYAYARFHENLIKGKVTLIGCPKLDAIDYSEKLKVIIRENNIQSVTIVRMEVPCCGGLEFAAKKALQESGKFIPWQVVTIGIDGNIKD